jgi:hypothetical protein
LPLFLFAFILIDDGCLFVTLFAIIFITPWLRFDISPSAASMPAFFRFSFAPLFSLSFSM